MRHSGSRRIPRQADYESPFGGTSTRRRLRDRALGGLQWCRLCEDRVSGLEATDACTVRVRWNYPRSSGARQQVRGLWRQAKCDEHNKRDDKLISPNVSVRGDFEK